jgi:two-component system phosphate regulon sensor histidine kinase PhoR
MKRILAPRSMTLLGIAVGLAAFLPLVVVAWLYCPDRRLVEVASVWAFVTASLGGVYTFGVVDGAFERIQRLARSIRVGNLETRLYPNRAPQLTPLYLELNQMSQAIEDRLRVLSNLSAEQHAVLRSMIEGVLVINQQGIVRTINRAALNFIEVTVLNAEGRSYLELFQHAELQRFVARALTQGVVEPITLTIGARVERIMEVQAAPLVVTEGVEPGVLFVMYDITRIHRLESLRRDFVANVSHELRTPVTSIKGFVETLIDGAKDNPKDLERFLQIIARQAERLNSIFNDLLTLARLEAGGEGANIEFEVRRVSDLIKAAVDDCGYRAADKGISIDVASAGNEQVRVNSSLIQQALVNLIDNAIKYSDPNKKVWIESKLDGDFVEIVVIDQGPGIAHGHLSRLFERFYRVDHGRSRQLGGTGLGLSIVKHIAQVHGGKVAVASVVGEGSRFSLFLPGTSEA